MTVTAGGAGTSAILSNKMELELTKAWLLLLLLPTSGSTDRAAVHTRAAQ